MNILRVSQYLYPDVTGGMAYHIHALSRDQTAMGHNVTVLTVRHDASAPKREIIDGYEVIRCDSIAQPLKNAIAPGMVRELWYSREYDVVHAHSHLYVSTNLSGLFSFLTQTPLAITNHGLYTQSAPETAFRWYLKTLGRWTFNRADVIFCYSETEGKRVRNLGVHRPIAVVGNGIDVTRFTPDGSVYDVMESQGPIVLFVGRLVEGKRPTVVVDAFAEVLEVHPGAKLVMVGDGPMHEEVELTVEKLGIWESVDLLGEVSYAVMPQVYRGANVLVLPSRVEGVPRTVMEALVSGLPVVCTDLDQLREQDLVGIRFVASAKPNDFARSIESTLNADKSGVREAAVRAFDWSRTVEETTTALDKLV